MRENQRNLRERNLGMVRTAEERELENDCNMTTGIRNYFSYMGSGQMGISRT